MKIKTQDKTYGISSDLLGSLRKLAAFDLSLGDRRAEILFEAADAIENLQAALKRADSAIVKGQSCRSEAEFNRWMIDSQQDRPPADFLCRFLFDRILNYEITHTRRNFNPSI